MTGDSDYRYANGSGSGTTSPQPQTGIGGAMLGGLGPLSGPIARNPNAVELAAETRGYLDQIEGLLDRLQGAGNVGMGNGPSDARTFMGDMARNCQQAAIISGRLKTLFGTD